MHSSQKTKKHLCHDVIGDKSWLSSLLQLPENECIHALLLMFNGWTLEFDSDMSNICLKKRKKLNAMWCEENHSSMIG